MQPITLATAKAIARSAIEEANKSPRQYYISTLHDAINDALEQRGYPVVTVISLDGSSVRSVTGAASEIYSAAMKLRDPTAFKTYVDSREAKRKANV